MGRDPRQDGGAYMRAHKVQELFQVRGAGPPPSPPRSSPFPLPRCPTGGSGRCMCGGLGQASYRAGERGGQSCTAS